MRVPLYVKEFMPHFVHGPEGVLRLLPPVRNASQVVQATVLQVSSVLVRVRVRVSVRVRVGVGVAVRVRVRVGVGVGVGIGVMGLGL
jgi:hypothetical protein